MCPTNQKRVKALFNCVQCFYQFLLQVLGTCFVRKGMDYIFTQRELKWLDDLMPEAARKEREDAKKKKEEEMAQNEQEVRRRERGERKRERQDMCESTWERAEQGRRKSERGRERQGRRRGWRQGFCLKYQLHLILTKSSGGFAKRLFTFLWGDIKRILSVFFCRSIGDNTKRVLSIFFFFFIKVRGDSVKRFYLNGRIFIAITNMMWLSTYTINYDPK